MAASLTRAAASVGHASRSQGARRRHQAAQRAAASPATAAAAAAAAAARSAAQHPAHVRRSQRVHWVPAAEAAEGNGVPEPSESTATQAATEGRGRPTWLSLLRGCMRLVQANLWPLLLVHCLADAAVFLLHRASHRITNQVAAASLHLDLSQVNPWYPVADPAVANFQTGYLPLSALFFLLALPLTVLLKSWASVATIQLCQGTVHTQPDGSAPAAWWQPLRGIREGLAALRVLRPQVAALWRRVFAVELLLQLAVAAAVVPSSLSAWGVATLPFALVLVLDLQAAAPAAVAEGLGGKPAVQRSRQLLRSLRWQLAIPFVGLLLGGRALEFAKASLLSSMPARFYTHLVEIPVAVLVGGTALQLWFALWRDVLPFAAYRHATEQEGGGSEAQGEAAAEQAPAAAGGSGPPVDAT
ncbi:hypothetical protein COHA_005429 [Chlorella ohadii]|uniref:Uncharacterized protein n=1 Tax=Chlorella ohadii TaxID=2649997 RepID=A0AAD5DRE9_9CHLO|nr:hypothetical protein COHA_005429 [Chlorella ohadii]